MVKHFQRLEKQWLHCIFPLNGKSKFTIEFSIKKILELKYSKQDLTETKIYFFHLLSRSALELRAAGY